MKIPKSPSPLALVPFAAVISSGFLRGKSEASGGKFVVPGTDVDAGLALGGALLAAAYVDIFGKYDDSAWKAGTSIWAHSVGEMARQLGKGK